MSHPQSYEILVFPEPEETATGVPEPSTAIRSAVVAATGQTGTSGYPRYAGDGLVADIDPASHTVEALLVDGHELDYGLTVRIAERIGGTEEPVRHDESPGEPQAVDQATGGPEADQGGAEEDTRDASDAVEAPDAPGAVEKGSGGLPAAG
ncbi:hypothetical protein [Streptomyces sp. NPDC056627]|uniref:hypothetical protein n=1 Tax=unclassified Streptomyces TaxID=2593676 RepID=UPI00368F4BA3